MDSVVVGIGEVLWDMLPTGMMLGGAPANFAYHVAQFGLESHLVSAVGHDALGDRVLLHCEASPVKCAVQRNDYPTGTVQVALDAQGLPSYEICRDVAWDHIAFTPPLQQLAARTRCVSFGTLAQRSEASRQTIRAFLNAMPRSTTELRVFDINLRQQFYSQEVIFDSMDLCNVLKINDEEIEVLARMAGYGASETDVAARRLLEHWRLRALVLTCGSRGSSVYTAERVSRLQTPCVEVVDTVGAGDAFAAAFCAVLLDGGTLVEAHRRAVEVSAYVCTCQGATPPLPDTLCRKVD